MERRHPAGGPPASRRPSAKALSAPAQVARTRDAADHPMLVANRDGAFLSWLTRAEGYRLLKLREAL